MSEWTPTDLDRERKRSLTSTRARTILAVVVVPLIAASWFLYWLWVLKPLVLETTYAKCVEHVKDAKAEQCRCVSRTMTDRLGKYTYLDRLFREDGLPPEEMSEILRACGLSSS